jgi:hypothetical protein
MADVPTTTTAQEYGQQPTWGVGRPRFHVFRLLLAWLVSATALLGAAWIVPGASVKDFGGALVAAFVIAALNAVLPLLGGFPLEACLPGIPGPLLPHPSFWIFTLLSGPGIFILFV